MTDVDIVEEYDKEVADLAKLLQIEGEETQRAAMDIMYDWAMEHPTTSGVCSWYDDGYPDTFIVALWRAEKMLRVYGEQLIELEFSGPCKVHFAWWVIAVVYSFRKRLKHEFPDLQIDVCNVENATEEKQTLTVTIACVKNSRNTHVWHSDDVTCKYQMHSGYPTFDPSAFMTCRKLRV